MEDRLKQLDLVFDPKSIAFVGATEGAPKWGFIIFNNIVTGGYEGKLYPVNPGRKTVLDIPAYPSVRDIPGEIDLVVFTVPASQVPGALEDSIARGVKAGVVISAGFKELGGEASKLEAEIVKRAREAGIVLTGPNGQGVCCPDKKLYCWMPLFQPPGGRVAFICQSGNILNMLIDRVTEAGFGVSKGVSSGNEADLRTEDYYSYFSEDPDTDVIVSYIEGIDDGRRFFDIAREVTRRKPVIVLKGGRSESGSAAARSHTGALAVSGSLFDDACRQAGIVLARSIEEAGILGASFINRPLPRGNRVGIVTGGGGLGVIAADACSQEGLIVPPLSEKTLSEIGSLMPDYWVPGNPIDLVAGLDLTIIKPIIETLLRSGEVDSILLIFVEAPRSGKPVNVAFGEKTFDLAAIWDKVSKRLAGYIWELNDLIQELSVPVFVTTNYDRKESWIEDRPADAGRTMVYTTVESACGAISAMAKYHGYLEGSH